MNYHHLSIEERSCIRKYYVDGLKLPRDRPADRTQMSARSHGRYGETVHICTTFQLIIRIPLRKSIC